MKNADLIPILNSLGKEASQSSDSIILIKDCFGITLMQSIMSPEFIKTAKNYKGPFIRRHSFKDMGVAKEWRHKLDLSFFFKEEAQQFIQYLEKVSGKYGPIITTPRHITIYPDKLKTSLKRNLVLYGVKDREEVEGMSLIGNIL